MSTKSTEAERSDADRSGGVGGDVFGPAFSFRSISEFTDRTEQWSEQTFESQKGRNQLNSLHAGFLVGENLKANLHHWSRQVPIEAVIAQYLREATPQKCSLRLVTACR